MQEGTGRDAATTIRPRSRPGWRFYEARTKPIEDIYARAGVPILVLEVGPLMTAEEMDASLRPRLTLWIV